MEDLIIGFIVGFICGWCALRSAAMQKVKLMVEEAESQESSPIPVVQKIRIDIRKENDIIYCYDKNNGAYLAQGDSYEDIQVALEKNYPNTVFMCNASQIAEITKK